MRYVNYFVNFLFSKADKKNQQIGYFICILLKKIVEILQDNKHCKKYEFTIWINVASYWSSTV